MSTKKVEQLPTPRQKLKRWQRIFVNRSLNLGYIKAIGFDMDHTLAIYNRENFETLAFRETLKKFIAAGYPEELNKLKFDPNFLIRGLLVDMDRGNLLKVDGHKYVKIAFHGHKKLDKATRHRLYNLENYKARDFLSVDSFFALSEVQLFTEIVDYMDNNPGKIDKTYREVYRDLRKFIDQSHADGSIKAEVMRHTDKYIHKDKYLAVTLVNLLEAGKNLFLLTNSQWDYTNHVMNYIFDGANEQFPNWRDYFDQVLVGGGKLGYFNSNQKLIELMTDSGLLKICNDRHLRPGRVYHGGNVKLFQELTGFRGDEILYVGDHLYGDIIRSKDDVNWRTMLVVEELEKELPILEDLQSGLEEIHTKLEQRELIDQKIQRNRSRMRINERQAGRALENSDTKKARALLRENDKVAGQIAEDQAQWNSLDDDIKGLILSRSRGVHDVWGEVMKVGLEKSRFADQVTDYACVYSSRVSNLRFYSPFKKFIAAHDMLPHDQV